MSHDGQMLYLNTPLFSNSAKRTLASFKTFSRCVIFNIYPEALSELQKALKLPSSLLFIEIRWDLNL